MPELQVFTAILSDDEPWILNALKKRIDWDSLPLSLAGTAANGIECLELVRTTAPDLVITDIRMPGIDGLELTEAIRKEFPDTQVILISGFSEFETARKGIELGVLGYLLKPIQQDQLNSLLEKAIDELKKKRTDITAEWRLFRTLIDRGTRSGNLYNLLRSLGISEPSESSLCIIAGDRSRMPVIPGLSIHHRQVGRGVSAHLVFGTKKQCSEFRGRLIAERKQIDGNTAVSSIHGENSSIGRIISEAETAFCRGHFAPVFNITEYREPTSEIGPLVEDCISSLDDGNWKRTLALLTSLRNGLESGEGEYDRLLPLVNSLIVRIQQTYWDRPETGVVVRPLGDVIELAFRYANSEDLFRELHELLDILANREPEAGISDSGLMIRVRGFIESHFAEDMPMDRLAERFDRDKNMLSQRFRATFGTSVSGFIRSIRMRHAALLLRTTDLPVSTVGELCGYSDYYYFARIFKKDNGLTCSQFRSIEKEITS